MNKPQVLAWAQERDVAGSWSSLCCRAWHPLSVGLTSACAPTLSGPRSPQSACCPRGLRRGESQLSWEVSATVSGQLSLMGTCAPAWPWPHSERARLQSLLRSGHVVVMGGVCKCARTDTAAQFSCRLLSALLFTMTGSKCVWRSCLAPGSLREAVPGSWGKGLACTALWLSVP